MTDTEIEQLIELAANKAANCVIEKAEKMWGKDIEFHAMQCSVNKYRGIKSFIMAATGGIIVAVVSWLLK